MSKINLSPFYLEQVDNLLVHGGNEIGDGGEVRLGISGQGHEDDVLPAGPLDLAAGDDAPRVGIEHDLQKNPGIVGRGAGLVVGKAGVEQGKVKLVVNEMVQGVLEGAGQDLLFKMDGDEFALAVRVRFVTGHDAISFAVVKGSPHGILQSFYSAYADK